MAFRLPVRMLLRGAVSQQQNVLCHGYRASMVATAAARGFSSTVKRRSDALAVVCSFFYSALFCLFFRPIDRNTIVHWSLVYRMYGRKKDLIANL